MKGFVYGQQKSIALFNCTGDWAFIWKQMKYCMKTICPKFAPQWKDMWTTNVLRRWRLIICTFTAIKHYRLISRLVSK
ncbi:MAG: hypothetical protein WDM76_13750 [Limisphaerales bacterium]